MGEELEGPEGSGEWDRLGGSGPPPEEGGVPHGGRRVCWFFWAVGSRAGLPPQGRSGRPRRPW